MMVNAADGKQPLVPEQKIEIFSIVEFVLHGKTPFAMAFNLV